MRRDNAPDLKNNNGEDETTQRRLQLTDACKRAVSAQNHGLPSEIICGSASSMCANTANLGYYEGLRRA